MSVQMLAHRPPVDLELVAQLVDGRAGLVPSDELLDLLAVDLPGRARQPASPSFTERLGLVGQPTEQQLQLADLVLCVVVGSPKLHPLLPAVSFRLCDLRSSRVRCWVTI